MPTPAAETVREWERHTAAADAARETMMNGRRVEVSWPLMRKAMAPAALWSPGWAKTAQEMAAQSPEQVQLARLLGMASMFFAVAALGCAVWALQAIKGPGRAWLSSATQARREMMLPQWEAEQLEAEAKKGQRQKPSQRL